MTPASARRLNVGHVVRAADYLTVMVVKSRQVARCASNMTYVVSNMTHAANNMTHGCFGFREARS